MIISKHVLQYPVIQIKLIVTRLLVDYYFG